MNEVMTAARICRRAEPADKQTLVATLADAFQNEPAFSFIIPDPEARKRALQRAFPIMVEEDMRDGAIMMTPGGEAAALWRVPGRMRHSRWDAIRTGLPYLFAFGTGIGRAALVSDQIQAHLPDEACWYLHYVGCQSRHRGRGHGGTVIRAGLAEADKRRCRAYLETADEANLPVYKALGFEVIQRWRVHDGPQFWGMMRPAY